MDYRLRVGESAVVHRNFFARSWSVTYAGMPSEDRCSLVLTWTMGYHATSCNLFLSDRSREMAFRKGRVRVLEMSPAEVLIEYTPG